MGTGFDGILVLSKVKRSTLSSRCDISKAPFTVPVDVFTVYRAPQLRLGVKMAIESDGNCF